jgi:hypothetical protein
MTIQDAVQMVDPKAELRPFGEGYWVRGNGWETKITCSAEKAWKLAQDFVMEMEIA